mgnify:CR=1 FL=1
MDSIAIRAQRWPGNLGERKPLSVTRLAVESSGDRKPLAGSSVIVPKECRRAIRRARGFQQWNPSTRLRRR